MYRCFKLSMHESDLFDQGPECMKIWKKQGEILKEELQNQIQDILKEVTDSEEIINGEKLSRTWFPIAKKDIFLSYSHDDEESALIIAGILKAAFGLDVFIDTLVWGSADALLKEIDKKYCLQSDGTYNYRKRNFSTSHVHAMLTTSIMKAMDQSEAIFFLNTSNSTYKLKDGFLKENTLSPWIYEEIMLGTFLKEKSWNEHREYLVNEKEHFQKELKVAYPISTDEVTEITFVDLVEWLRTWEKRKEIGNGKYGATFLKAYERIMHPLNVLYEIKFDVKESE